MVTNIITRNGEISKNAHLTRIARFDVSDPLSLVSVWLPAGRSGDTRMYIFVEKFIDMPDGSLQQRKWLFSSAPMLPVEDQGVIMMNTFAMAKSIEHFYGDAYNWFGDSVQLVDTFDKNIETPESRGSILRGYEEVRIH